MARVFSLFGVGAHNFAEHSEFHRRGMSRRRLIPLNVFFSLSARLSRCPRDFALRCKARDERSRGFARAHRMNQRHRVITSQDNPISTGHPSSVERISKGYRALLSL
jgi:hypothetical protein